MIADPFSIPFQATVRAPRLNSRHQAQPFMAWGEFPRTGFRVFPLSGAEIPRQL